MSCKIQPIHFAASKFTVIDEFEGEKGFFLKGFLINNKMNANGWMVTNQANINNGKDFVGKPDIEFFKDGNRDHTVGDTLQESLRLQEPFRKGTIIKVIDVDGRGTKLEAISRITDTKTIKNIKVGDVLFYSPAIFPRSMADVEIISTGPDSHMHIIHGYHALHRALVDDPAFGKGDAKITQTCEGSPEECSVKLAQLKAGIGDDEINPLRQVKLVDVKKCSKTGALTFELEKSEFSNKVTEILSTVKDPTDKDLVDAFSKARKSIDENNSHIGTQNTKDKNLATEEEREKEIAKLTAQVDELVKDKAEAKKAAEEEKKKEEGKKGNEDDSEKKDGNEDEKKGKKGNEEETKKNLTAEEEKKKEQDMTARIASEVAEKLPLVEKFVAAKTLVASLDEKAQTELREKMLKASLDDVKRDWENIEPFAASLQFEKDETKSQSKYNYGGHVASTNLDNKSTEELLTELTV